MNGNRLSRIANGTTDSYAYAPASNRPTQQVGVAIGVDAAGNITSDGAYSYQYNRRGLLYRVYQSGAAVANYSYNALGQRTLKTLSGGKTVYQYGPGGQLLAEIGKDAQGDWTAFDYVWRGERPVARFKTQVTAAGAASTQESLILHTDALGSPTDASNSQGNVVWRWTHEAFGATAPNQDPDGNGQATQLNLRFPGQYYDAETGLHYNVHRYYQPKTGRYMSSDPIGVLGGINTYTYALNNPLRYTDPQGLFVGVLASRVAIPALEYLGTAIAGSALGVSIYNAVKGDVEADAPDGSFSWVDPGRQTTNDKLKEDWENQTGESWPVDPDTGKSQDASHEIPLADGGPDHVSNIQPRPGQEHQDLHTSRGDRSRWGKRRWRKCP